jgi:trehalose utilization protein
MMMIRVTVWSEYRHEKRNPKIAEIYPNGMHGAIARSLADAGFTVRTATLDEPEHGLTEEVLANTDVLTWWGHMAHGDVSDVIVERVHKRVLEGMGLIVLHSAHGHLMRFAVARGRRTRAPVGRFAWASDCRGYR